MERERFTRTQAVLISVMAVAICLIVSYIICAAVGIRHEWAQVARLQKEEALINQSRLNLRTASSQTDNAKDDPEPVPAGKRRTDAEWTEWSAWFRRQEKIRQASTEAAILEASKPETLTLKKLKTRKVGDSIGVLVDDDSSQYQIEDKLGVPSKTFALEDFAGKTLGEIYQVVPTKEGGIALATNTGGYVISKDGKSQVIGAGRPCTAVAVSSRGEIAFGFSFSRDVKIKFTEGNKTQSRHFMANEVHVVGGTEPRTILLGEYFGGLTTISRLAYNKDGTILAATATEGLMLVKGDRVWAVKEGGSKHLGWILNFSPAKAEELLCSSTRVWLDLDRSSGWAAYLGGYRNGHPLLSERGRSTASFDPAGEIISIKPDWDGHLALWEGPLSSPFNSYKEAGPRWYGADRMAVNDKYVVYTALSVVNVWDRKKKEQVQTFEPVPRGTGDTAFLRAYVEGIAFRPNGPLIVHTGDGEVSEWNPESGEKTKVLVSPAK